MKLLLAVITSHLFGWCWVWTEDYDGAPALRRIHLSPFGRVFIYGNYATICTIHPDGTIRNSGSLRRWLHYTGPLPTALTGIHQ